MTRIAELQTKYPSIHKDIIVKWDVVAQGIRDSRDLDKVSSWKPASRGSYLSYESDLTMKRMKSETPWRVRENAVLLPDSLLMKTGLGFSLRRDERSSYAVREVSEGKFALFEGDEIIEVDLYRTPRKARQEPEPELVTSKGTPVGELVELNRRCYRVVPVRFCEYFTTGDQCRFCNFNPTQEEASSIGLKRSITINPEDTAEAFKMVGSEVRLLEGMLEGGGFARSETESSVNCKFVEKMNSALPYKTDMKLVAEAMPRRELLRLRDAGLSGIRFQMEVFDERLFPVINPGKTKHLSRDGWLEAFQDAVEIFGAGNVGAKFVGGVTLPGPNGYATWQEARDSHLEGDRWMISHGVFPCMQALRWAPGSVFARDPANRDRVAPTEFFLDLAVAHHEAMKEFGLYEKLNKFLYCGLCCRTGVYVGEIGILELAGDFGAWMSDVVPEDANWLARAIDEMRSSTRTLLSANSGGPMR